MEKIDISIPALLYGQSDRRMDMSQKSWVVGCSASFGGLSGSGRATQMCDPNRFNVAGNALAAHFIKGNKVRVKTDHNQYEYLLLVDALLPW